MDPTEKPHVYDRTWVGRCSICKRLPCECLNGPYRYQDESTRALYECRKQVNRGLVLIQTAQDILDGYLPAEILLQLADAVGRIESHNPPNSLP